LSIYLGLPGIGQSGARAVSDRLTHLEAENEPSDQLRIQLSWFYSPCTAARAPDPTQTNQSKNRAAQHPEPAGQTAAIIMPGTAWTHGPMLLVYTLTLWYEIQSYSWGNI